MSDDTYLSISIEDVLPTPGTPDSTGVVFPAEVITKLREDLKKLYPDGKIKVKDPGHEFVELRVHMKDEGGRFVCKIPQMSLEIPIESVGGQDTDEAVALGHVKKTLQEMADRAIGALYIDLPAHLDEEWGNPSIITIKVRRDTIHHVTSTAAE